MIRAFMGWKMGLDQPLSRLLAWPPQAAPVVPACAALRGKVAPGNLSFRSDPRWASSPIHEKKPLPIGAELQ